MHFYLCNLQVPRSDSIEEFIEYVKDRVSKVGFPQIVQIMQIMGDRMVDVAVNMKYDSQAIMYMQGLAKKVGWVSCRY